MSHVALAANAISAGVAYTTLAKREARLCGSDGEVV